MVQVELGPARAWGFPVRVWAVIVAGGSGARFGGEKQFALLGDRPVLAWSVGVARGAVGAGGVVLVVPPHRSGGSVSGADIVVSGGPTRSASVRAGLAALPPGVEIVVVHDAARPLASARLFEAVIEAVVAGADAAVPGLEVTDSIRRRQGGTIDRSGLVRVQTPQAFRAAALLGAHVGNPEATDDATLVEQAGGSVVVVAGEPTNLKLTEPGDLAVAELFLRRAEPLATAPPGSPIEARGGPAR